MMGTVERACTVTPRQHKEKQSWWEQLGDPFCPFQSKRPQTSAPASSCPPSLANPFIQALSQVRLPFCVPFVIVWVDPTVYGEGWRVSKNEIFQEQLTDPICQGLFLHLFLWQFVEVRHFFTKIFQVIHIRVAFPGFLIQFSKWAWMESYDFEEPE